MRPRLAFVVLVAACSSPAKQPAPPPTPAPPAPRAMTLADTGVVPEWIDATADPCTDFFQYACGGFTRTATIPSDRAQWGALMIVEQNQEDVLHDLLEHAMKDPHGDPVLTKIGDYYAACVDEPAIEKAGLAPIQPLLDQIDHAKDARAVMALVPHLHMVGVRAFFDVGPTQDFADATQEIAGFDQGGLGMPDRDYYFKSDGNMKQVRDAYATHVAHLFALAGATEKDARERAANALRIEVALAGLAMDKVRRRDPHAIYHRIERAGLEKAAPGIAWDDYFAAIGAKDVTQVTVSDRTYFTGLDALLHKEKPAALRDYLTARVLAAAAPHLGKAFVDEDFAFHKLLSGEKEVAPRWRRCVHRVDEDLGELLGRPYVAARFAGNSKGLAIDLTEAVRGALASELDTLPWMDDTTRAAAKAKLAKMAHLVGYPDTWREYDFPISRTDYASNVAAAAAFEFAREIRKIGKPVDKNEWEMTPPTVNAYYEPTLNEIALPAGQLQPPFFGATFHPAVNFGSTGGGTIGHEMTHGFDDEGSQFDGDGNLRDWWSAATKKQFTAATQCVIDQYGQYEAVPGVKLNGKLTVGENIADIGGVKLGLIAYHAWRAQQKTPPPAKVAGYTDDQLYFIAYAQSWCMKTTPERLESMAHTNEHSPPMWRVNGVVVDQPAFAPAFACKVGAPMNPGNACSVW